VDLVSLAQLANLAFQCLHLVSDLGRDTGTLAAVNCGLLTPLMQRLRNEADRFGKRYYRRPAGRVIALVIKNHPYRPLADFWRKLVRRLARRRRPLPGRELAA
jgi:hypothetical protein